MFCYKPEWKTEHPEDGFPYLECKPKYDVAGRKVTVLSVAGQTTTENIDYKLVCLNVQTRGNRYQNRKDCDVLWE